MNKKNRLPKRKNRLLPRLLPKSKNWLPKRKNRLPKRKNRLPKRKNRLLKRKNRMTKRNRRMPKKKNRICYQKHLLAIDYGNNTCNRRAFQHKHLKSGEQVPANLELADVAVLPGVAADLEVKVAFHKTIFLK